MKFILVFILCICCGLISAQNSNNTLTQSLSSISKSNANNFGAFMSFSNPKNNIEGSVHLFNSWNNKVVIHTMDNNKFTISNINLNIQLNTFESKIAKDSLFSFNFNGIEKFVINNKVFKNFYYDDDNRVYELIYESDELAILKGFSIQIIAGSPNPMLNRSKDKYIQKQSYFIKKNDEINPFRLNRKALMKLFNNDEVKVTKVENYIKTDQLANKGENIDLGSSLNQNYTEDSKTGSATVEVGLSNLSSHGASFYFRNPKRIVDGTFYLFEDWKNHAVIYVTGNQSFVLKNINLNLKRNVFETRVAMDSIFTFNFNNIDKFIVNNKVYKNFYYNEDNRVYEMIFESDKLSLLKGFKVELIEGSANPMLNRSRDKYVRRHDYFIKSDNTIKPFKLKRSKIKKLMGDDTEKLKKIETYIKNNKLSYKKEDDVRKILEYIYKE